MFVCAEQILALKCMFKSTFYMDTKRFRNLSFQAKFCHEICVPLSFSPSLPPSSLSPSPGAFASSPLQLWCGRVGLSR